MNMLRSVVIAATLTSIPLVSQAVSLPSLTGVVLKEHSSSYDSAAAKTASVTCGLGQSVIGISGRVSGSGKVILDEMAVSDDLTTVTVAGKETDNLASTWSVTAIAICADTPSGLEKNVQSSVDSSSAAPKNVSGWCSYGKTMLGMGADIVGGKGEVDVYKMAPNFDAAGRPTGVDISAAKHDKSFSGSWHVNAYTICADPVDLQQIVYADTEPTTDEKGITVYCPFGSVATGTGFDVQNALTSTTGGDSIENAVVTSVDPGGSASTPTTGTSLYAQLEDKTKNSSIWTLRSYAVCARGN
jgi:uncharacterized low-complexity protein